MQAVGLLVVLLVACSSESLTDSDREQRTGDDTPQSCDSMEVASSLLEAADGFARENDLDVASCGARHSPSGPSSLACCEEVREPRQCLFDALQDCTPKRYTEVIPSIEGDPIVVTYFVVPRGEACEVLVFEDASRDRFLGAGDALSTLSCRSILEPHSAHSCGRLQVDDCY